MKLRLLALSSLLSVGLVACSPAPNNPGDSAVPRDAAEARESSVQQEGGTNPTDGGAQPLPDLSNWPAPDAPVTFSAEGFGSSSAQLGQGSAQLGIGPIGTPSNSRILSFSWDNFLGSGVVAMCRVGLLYDSAAGAYSFSGDAQLTQPCTIGAGADATTLTFTGLTVARAPAGNLTVTINTTAAGARLTGTGTLKLIY